MRATSPSPAYLFSMPHIRTFAAVLIAALPVANAWGTLGHETVAFIAQDRMAAHTVSWAQGVLDNTSTSYLAGIAAWADTYRYTPAGTFSAPFHFIDAEDSPPSLCSVDYDRDCGAKGCVVSAIANYTQRVVSTTLSNTEVNHALRFLVHFVGDIHQPLHDEALEIGGNDIDVTFAGASTNLHHIWDTEIPEKFVGGYSLSDAKAWAQTLNTATKSGIYASQVASWTKGLDVTDPVTTALDWASEANAYVCSTVMPNGQAAVEDVDLGGAYYASAISVVELQIARAGVRLAAYLDAIAKNQKVLTKRLVQDDVDMSGANLLPDTRPLSKAKLVREAVGYGCKH
ncbi:nuclease s1 [Aureobasidium pullulans]|uniref:Nuclease s1 n=2 Tax=Aureobasidium pullulans TaxID=5580 RepID=A0A4S9YN60_AURPU|nr:nuclease s1 [Aureobasidium pullulans]THZ94672.1 nuclease s1 [Aureobasidium pullulans]